MTITVGDTPVQSIYVGSTPVQAVFVGDTQIWPTMPPPPLQWFRWESHTFPELFCYTNTRNPEVGTRTYEKSGDDYVPYETVGKIYTDPDGDVTQIITMYNPSTETGYWWTYMGQEA